MWLVINWEIVKVVGIYWIIVWNAVWAIVDIKSKRYWLFSFLEKESAESLEKKIFSFDEALNAKFIIDEQGTISNVNTAAEELFGYKEKDVRGKSIEVIVPIKDQAYFKSMLTDNKAAMMMQMVTKAGYEVPVEVVIKKKTLKERSFFIVVIHDRTREVQTARKYEQVIGLLKIKIQILDAGEEIGNTGSWLWDLKTGEMTPSEGYKRILGMEANIKFDPMEIRKKVWDEDEQIVVNALERAFKGDTYDISYRMKRASDFKLIYIRSIVKPIKDDDNIVIAFYGSTRLLQTSNLRDASDNPITK